MLQGKKIEVVEELLLLAWVQTPKYGEDNYSSRQFLNYSATMVQEDMNAVKILLGKIVGALPHRE